MIPWDKLEEECGIFGIVAHPEAARMAYLGIYALQHRGQESAGIVTSDRKQLHIEKGMGYVADIISISALYTAFKTPKNLFVISSVISKGVVKLTVLMPLCLR